MQIKNLVGPWIRRFLLEYVIGARNLARNTQVSYRDTLKLLILFAAGITKQPIERLSVEDLTPAVLRQFLGSLEEERGCSIRTRNQRLSAFHSLARFIAMHSPEHLAWCAEVCAIPFKRSLQPTLIYLEKPEMEALLATPNRRSAQGFREYAVLLFLYNTGARADEAARLTTEDLDLEGSPSVRIRGKGGKIRHCPLWLTTAQVLASLIAQQPATARVFVNRRGQPITRFGLHALVRRCALRAAVGKSSLARKKISPHTLRHTTAVHLLRAGVDINTIRAWLGHVSLDTTHVYAEVDLEMKAQALARCEISEAARESKLWHKDRSLMSFLQSL
jgi:integrase/recombinase XerD